MEAELWRKKREKKKWGKQHFKLVSTWKGRLHDVPRMSRPIVKKKRETQGRKLVEVDKHLDLPQKFAKKKHFAATQEQGERGTDTHTKMSIYAHAWVGL